MRERIATILASAFVLAMAVGPAIAGQPSAQPLPEPATLTLFGVGIAGAYIAKKFIGRK